jgi:hypothetical protein
MNNRSGNHCRSGKKEWENVKEKFSDPVYSHYAERIGPVFGASGGNSRYEWADYCREIFHHNRSSVWL